MIATPLPDRSFQKQFIDLIGPYRGSKSGTIGAIVVLVHSTKFIFLEPIRLFVAEFVTRFLMDRVFNVFGTLELVFTDNGVQFRSVHFGPVVRQRVIKHVFTALYSPQANAPVRVNQFLIAAIRA